MTAFTGRGERGWGTAAAVVEGAAVAIGRLFFIVVDVVDVDDVFDVTRFLLERNFGLLRRQIFVETILGREPDVGVELRLVVGQLLLGQ